MNPIRLTSFINAFFALCLLALAAPARADLFVSSYLTGSVQEFTTSGSLVGSFVAAGERRPFQPHRSALRSRRQPLRREPPRDQGL